MSSTEPSTRKSRLEKKKESKRDLADRLLKYAVLPNDDWSRSPDGRMTHRSVSHNSLDRSQSSRRSFSASVSQESDQRWQRQSLPKTPKRVESLSTIRQPRPSGGTSPDLEAPEYEYVDGTKPKEKTTGGGGGGVNGSIVAINAQPRAAIVFGINNFLILIALIVGFSIIGTQVNTIKNFLIPENGNVTNPLEIPPRLAIQLRECSIPKHADPVVSYWYRKPGETSDSQHLSNGGRLEKSLNITETRKKSSGQDRLWVSQDGRIFGGDPAEIEDYPWQVSMHSAATGHQCGASLITTRWLLTAAHCRKASDDPADWKAFFGIKYQPSVESCASGHWRAINAIVYKHPQWNEDTYQNDIALMRMTQDVQWTDKIMPICIGSAFTSEITGGSRVHVSGFGDTQNRDTDNGEEFQSSQVLNSVEVEYIAQDTCQDWYGEDHTMLDDQLCAGLESGGKDSCVADSGGPLVSAKQINGDVVWFQLGIVSFGYKCGVAKEKFIKILYLTCSL
ncbi:Oidioi.mRNA.OKI2018_I69.PAR.g11060.t1.cds [Oikopleura dioica]|uniref:Oidioi.mRNA.OKI2018_I69.PAR.g11060.t1.cds n=1 Tax=Oikopleura dioica TaxID=34765 RepID=A0ABN7RYS1_OIKDI|nr:Oidioi.mRNA.OKI2018_I69.PAR.g11060.t1.cds [Oikopleura dioica]